MRIDDRQDHCVIHGVDCASGEDCPECGKVAAAEAEVDAVLTVLDLISQWTPDQHDTLEAEAEEDFQAKLRYAQKNYPPGHPELTKLLLEIERRLDT